MQRGITNVLLPHLTLEPCTGVGPVAFGGSWGNAENFGGLFDGETREVTKLDQFRKLPVFDSKFVERFVQGKQLVNIVRGYSRRVVA